MSKIKAIFFDVDGTLISFRTRSVPLSAQRALREAAEQGVLLFIATGRHWLGLSHDLFLSDSALFTGHVTLNGQYCCCGSELVFSQAIDPRDVAEMVRYQQEAPLPCQFMEADHMYITCIDDHVRQVYDYMRRPLPEIAEPGQALGRDIYQMVLYLQEGVRPAVLDRMSHCTYTSWNTFGLDITPKGGSKWEGIRRILQRFGIAPEETAAFGDSSNDLEMLRGAGVGIAMGNGSQEVHSAADRITATVDEDGILKGMRALLQW